MSRAETKVRLGCNWCSGCVDPLLRFWEGQTRRTRWLQGTNWRRYVCMCVFSVMEIYRGLATGDMITFVRVPKCHQAKQQSLQSLNRRSASPKCLFLLVCCVRRLLLSEQDCWVCYLQLGQEISPTWVNNSANILYLCTSKATRKTWKNWYKYKVFLGRRPSVQTKLNLT